MATSLYFVIVIMAFAFAEEIAAVDSIAAGTPTNITPSGELGGLLDMEQAIAGDLDLKMLMMNDGSPRGKCYCSCSLNNKPVFLEIDSSNLPGTYAVE